MLAEDGVVAGPVAKEADEAEVPDTLVEAQIAGLRAELGPPANDAGLAAAIRRSSG